ncbi:hypothetical protein [Sulfurospirillum sp. 1612]|uniref:hypothetical protein n=1 Tax=Sulfurospirillum sp. 1612 TaxID=3094835 RepID=UPI002F95B4F4
MLQNIFAKKHILWIQLMYASVMAKSGESVRMFETFEAVEFRHLKWLADIMLTKYREFDYQTNAQVFDFNRDIPPIDHDFNIFVTQIKTDLQTLSTSYTDDLSYHERFASDEIHFAHRIEKLQESKGFEAFDSFCATTEDIAKKYNIDIQEATFVQEALGDLVDKEYQSVLSFFYLITHLDNKKFAESLSDLMYESMSHMKYYAILMSSLGILRLPRCVDKKEYMISNLANFLDKNIQDEIDEVAYMEQIAHKTQLAEFKNLLEFIQRQEEHHIMILKSIRENI